MTPHALCHFIGSTSMFAFIPDTLSWLHVADLPEFGSAFVLPFDELLVVNEDSDSVQSITTRYMCITMLVLCNVNVSDICAHCIVHQYQ